MDYINNVNNKIEVGGTMRILDTAFHDVKILHFNCKEDIRGSMSVTIDHAEMVSEGIYFNCKEQRMYSMARKGTFFGIHFQNKAYPQNKLIHLLSGSGLDILLI